MNNLCFGNLDYYHVFFIAAEYIPPEKVHPKMFPEQWITSERYPAEMRRKRLKEKQEAASSLEMKLYHCARVMKRVRLSLGKLAELDITDYTPQIYVPESLQLEFFEEKVKAEKEKEQSFAA